ncbi:hypothetical protein K7X08_027614 [Anisodus acutangulus]|uniref:FAF domain-containing protein n=1 Tax=Anisodus acutangulus TaxID=402998 RepID=A0A9Q1MKH7_9SOLA|nr:hypothetical protein K7X08_027614 [Anisodus acutangulus]
MHWLESSTQEHGLDYLGDFIGVESCIDLQSDINMEPNTQCDSGIKKMKKEKKKEKEYPPPIPWLACTKNLTYSQIKMPWIMKRYYTEDGRLIIKEEKMKHYEYFEAHRSEGRLMLRLIPLNDEVLSTDDNDDSENELVEDEQEVIIHEEKEEKVEKYVDLNKSDEELNGENELANVIGDAQFNKSTSKETRSFSLAHLVRKL